MPPKASVPPPVPKAAPPPAEKYEPMTDVGSDAGLAAVMNELTSGNSVQLRKVTDDMKTKNMKRDDIPHPAPPAARRPAAACPAAVTSKAFPLLPPVCEIQRSNWVVENYVNHQGVLKLDECDMKQIVYISKCTNTTIHVDSKVKSITLDGCKRVNLIVHSVISSVELVNCERCKVHSVNELPSLCIDKCSGVAVTLSQSSLACEFTTSKSSEMNVLVPIGTDGDYKEMAIPEQYVHRVTGSDSNNYSLKTEVSALYH
jgi:adenylyl cyclase-associated protein